jgi:ADP-heptose:LPS heptosyltransferase
VILFPGALGDLLLVAPALRGLRARHPGRRAVVAVGAWLRDVAAIADIGDEIASLDDADTAGLFGGVRRPRWLGARPVVYSWLGARDPAVGTCLRALAERVELLRVIRDDGPEHAAVAYATQVGLAASAVAPLGWRPPTPGPRVAVFLAATTGPLLAVHAGAGSPVKRWAPAGFAHVAASWRRAGGEVVELVGPAEDDLAPLASVRRAVGWPLRDVVALLASARAFVGNDSGIAHLAAAAGTPAVVVFGPTAARRWAPLGADVTCVQGVGAGAAGIDVTDVTPEIVWRATSRFAP